MRPIYDGELLNLENFIFEGVLRGGQIVWGPQATPSISTVLHTVWVSAPPVRLGAAGKAVPQRAEILRTNGVFRRFLNSDVTSFTESRSF